MSVDPSVYLGADVDVDVGVHVGVHVGADSEQAQRIPNAARVNTKATTPTKSTEAVTTGIP